jgi:protease I
MKSIVMVIAPSEFRDEEYLHPKEEFIKNSVKVVTASTKLEECKGKLGLSVKPDILVNDINIDEFDAICFVGGIGSKIYFDDKFCHDLVNAAFEKNKIVSAICIAPMILVNSGVLKGKKATVFPSEKEDMIKKGVNYTGKPVEISGKTVTANGPESARDFARKIIEILKDK